MVIYCLFGKGGAGLPVDAPVAGIKAGFPGMEAALADLSRLLGLKRGFSWSARTERGRVIVNLSGAPAKAAWMARWAAWVALDALGQADPVLKKVKVFGGITGVDGLSLPGEDLQNVEFNDVVNLANLGIPHAGLRAGAGRLLERGGELPVQAVAGLTAPVRGIPETLLFSQFSHALFLDPWTAAVERLPDRAPMVRVTTRPLPVDPHGIWPAYASAVRALLRCSAV